MKNCEKLNKKLLRSLIYMQNEKSVPPMDFTCVSIIIGGTIKKIKIKFIQGGGPDGTEQKM